MPFYRVDEKGSEKPRLVEADNPAAAMRHVASGHFTVSKPLKTSDLAKLMGGGAKMEKAGVEAEPEPATEAGDGDQE